MNDNFKEIDIALGPEMESLSLEELERRLLGLKNELDELDGCDAVIGTPQVIDGETVLVFDAVKPHNEDKKCTDESGFKGLDGEKAVADENFEFKLESIDVNQDGGAEKSHPTEIDEVGESAGEYIEDNDLFKAAARLVVEERVTSVSFLQRHFGIGYAKASAIVSRLEELAIVSPVDGNNPRRVLVSSEKLEKILAEL